MCFFCKNKQSIRLKKTSLAFIQRKHLKTSFEYLKQNTNFTAQKPE